MELCLKNNSTKRDCEVKGYIDVISNTFYFREIEFDSAQSVSIQKWDNNFTIIKNSEKFVLRDLKKNKEIVMSFSELPTNWNDNGAGSFSPDLIEKTIAILNSLSYQPEVFPTGSESILLEYSKPDGRYLGIEVSRDKINVFNPLNEEVREFDTQHVRELNHIVNEFND